MFAAGYCTASGRSGKEEPTSVPEVLQKEVLVIAPTDEAAPGSSNVRRDVRESSFAYLYNRFSLNNGKVSIEFDTSAQIILVESRGSLAYYDVTIVPYRVDIHPSGGYQRKVTKTVEFSFRYTQEDTEKTIRRQPSVRALIEGIREAEIKAGWVKLQSLTYDGKGKFSAVVDIASE